MLVVQYGEIPFNPPRRWRTAWFVANSLMRTYTFPKLLAVLAMAGIVCYGLARYISRPVVRLRAATRELAKGNLSARVAPTMGSRQDELADLSRDFDQMARFLLLFSGFWRPL